jgi:hypothetical protein
MVALARHHVKSFYPHVQAANQRFVHVPQELKLLSQWVTWKWGKVRDNGKREKKPYTPQIGKAADITNPATWGTYLQSLIAYSQGGYDGIGFVFNGHSYTGIDLDNSLHTGELDTWAREIISQFRGAYVEVSPSGSGVKLIVRGNLKGDRHRTDSIEVYDNARFFTITGDALSTSKELPDHQEELDAWYSRTFPAPPQYQPVETSSELDDNQVLSLLGRAKNRTKFQRLWEGDTTGYRSRSEADLALLTEIAFYTQDEEQVERIARQSGLVRGKWDEHPTYLSDSIQKAVDSLTSTYQPRKHVDSRTEYSYAWQQQSSGDLPAKAREVREAVRRHKEEGSATVLAVRVPPGVGKSTEIAAWGKDQDIAYLVERHDQVEQVADLKEYRHIQPCTSENCPDPKQHEFLSRRGYNTWPLHSKHRCEYGRQFKEKGSAVYQIAHAQTSYPVLHSGIVVDEFNLTNWITEQIITPKMISKSLRYGLVSIVESNQAALDVLSAICTLIETGQPLYGKALFDELDRQLRGRLAAFIQTIAQDQELMEARPKLHHYEIQGQEDVIAYVILPTLIQAMQQELPKWQAGQEWNSSMRIDTYKGEYALHILQPRRFQGEGTVAVLDATAHPGLIGKILGRPVQVKEVQVDPPPHTRHIAVRTGKRYGKYTLTDGERKGQDVQRVVKELRYLLRKINPDGTKAVGLITYQGCENEIGDALGVPPERRGHFWGIRGSNAFEGCDILLVVGTPTPNLDMIENTARMLYADDPEVIDTTTGPDGMYKDARLRELVDYLTNAELTQAAHRNRPLRYDGRVVVTLSKGVVDFLPITTEITGLPRLKNEGRSQTEYEQERLRQATARLREKGVSLSVRKLMDEIGRPGIRRETVMAYVKEAKTCRS